MKRLIGAALIAGCISCAPSGLLVDGMNKHAMWLKSINGEDSFQSKEVQVQSFRIVIVDTQMKMPCVQNWVHGTEIVGCASSTPYSTTLYVKGKLVDGRYVVPPAVLGHEVLHVIENAVDIMPVHKYEAIK